MSAITAGALRPRRPQRSRRFERGQSLAEFALIFPVVMLLLLGVADMARWYNSAIAVQSAAREAADFGSFQATYWANTGTPPTNRDKTIAAMLARACTAASNTPDYVGSPPGSATMTCANPALACTISPPDGVVGAPVDCTTYNGTDWGCPSIVAPDPPCKLTVRMTHTFHLFFGIPPMPSTITFTRDSTFALSNL
jgi:hypothetical protein